MKKFVAPLVILIIVVIGIWYVNSKGSEIKDGSDSAAITINSNESRSAPNDFPEVSSLAQNLDTPWGMVFLPDGKILVTERKGTVRLIENGSLKDEPVALISNSQEIGEGGLLGIELHPGFAKASSGEPNFSSNNYIYLYYTYQESSGSTLNRVVRMKYLDGKLNNEEVIVDKIPGSANHNGGRIKFGPDKLLYIGTGDAQDPSRAQDINSLSGKILRVTDEGKPAPGNPYDNLVYSLGHRNVQGLTWNQDGTLFTTEHGRSGALSGYDEINQVESGKNYGWPEIQGDQTKNNMTVPIKHSGATTTWAPSGIAYLNGSLYFGGLRGESLYQAILSGNEVVEVKTHFKAKFGRIRDVVVGPDNMLYISTSNLDGRGSPAKSDDQILKINPSKLQ